MYIVECLAVNPFTQKPYNPCGSDYTFIFHDLKTIKGVINRVKNNYYLRKNVIALCIYKGNIYQKEKIKVITDLTGYKFMNF